MPLSFVELEEAFRGLFDGRLRNLRLAVPASQLQFSEPRRDVGLAEVRSRRWLCFGFCRHVFARLQPAPRRDVRPACVARPPLPSSARPAAPFCCLSGVRHVCAWRSLRLGVQPAAL